MPDIDAAIAQLRAAGAEVSVRYRPEFPDVPHTSAFDFWLDPGECNAFAADPEGFAAKVAGVSRGEYAGWLEAGGRLFCAARTKQGRRCKCTVSGYSYGLHPAKWARLEAEGRYCSIHGGD